MNATASGGCTHYFFIASKETAEVYFPTTINIITGLLLIPDKPHPVGFTWTANKCIRGCCEITAPTRCPPACHAIFCCFSSRICLRHPYFCIVEKCRIVNKRIKSPSEPYYSTELRIRGAILIAVL